MTYDPFSRLNEAHRKLDETPWSPPPRRHQFRDEWHRGKRKPHMDARDFMRPSLVQLGARWLDRRPWIFVAIALAALAYFGGRVIYAAIAWHWA